MIETLNLNRKPKKQKNPIIEKAKKKEADSPAIIKQKSRRNVKVYDETLYNLSAFSQFKNMTQDELIQWLLLKEIKSLNTQDKVIFEHLKTQAENKNNRRK